MPKRSRKSSPPAPAKSVLGRPLVLSLEQVADGVLAVGFAGFTVRKLATELDVDYSTLYRYAPHRDGLVALGLDRLLRLDGMVLYEKRDHTLGWRDVLERAAQRVWRFLEKYPGVAVEMAKVTLPVRVFELATVLGDALVERGFEPENAALAIDFALDLAVNLRSGAEYLDAHRARTDSTGRRSLAERAQQAAPFASNSPMPHAFQRLVEESPKRVFERSLVLALSGVERHLAPPGS